tara:strand:- start:1354 stop:1644 length:291 start_codon:yes stop_codon:yes gene_type:complete
MADIHERDTYVAATESGSSTGAWVFGIFVAALAALGIWYFSSAAPVDDGVTTAPATQTEESAPATTMDSAPAAPAEDAAPAAPADDAAPATPAPAE